MADGSSKLACLSSSSMEAAAVARSLSTLFRASAEAPRSASGSGGGAAGDSEVAAASAGAGGMSATAGGAADSVLLVGGAVGCAEGGAGSSAMSHHPWLIHILRCAADKPPVHPIFPCRLSHQF